jgi:hypothetical protein
MIKRLRPKWSDEELAKVYDHQYDHKSFADHILRVEHTIEFARDNVPMDKTMLTVADLSAGDGAIANGLPFPNKILGDFYPGFEYVGKIEETIEQIPVVDLFILSETLEHVDNPGAVLKQIRNKTKYLLVSTPEDNWDGVEGLLKDAGFEPIAFLSEKLWYTHQYWICK